MIHRLKPKVRLYIGTLPSLPLGVGIQHVFSVTTKPPISFMYCIIANGSIDRDCAPVKKRSSSSFSLQMKAASESALGAIGDSESGSRWQ